MRSKCSNCKYADFRYNDAPVGSGRSAFLCTKYCEYRSYSSEACKDWKDRHEEETR